MRKLAAFLLLCLASLGVHAYTLEMYVSDCQSGAHVNCVAGSSGNDGLTAATPKRLPTDFTITQRRTLGSAMHWAMGGKWTGQKTNMYIPSSSTYTTLPYAQVNDAYTPSWCTGTCATARVTLPTGSHPTAWQPYTWAPHIVNATAGASVWELDDGNYLQDGKYLFTGLHISCAGTGNWGFFITKNVDVVTIDKNEIELCKNAVFSSQNPQQTTGQVWTNTDLSVTSNYIHDNSASAFLGGSYGIVYQNNVDERNGSAMLFDHDIYMSDGVRGTISNNTIFEAVPTSSSSATANGQPGAVGKCGASIIVVHGQNRGLVIERNWLYVPAAGAISQCYGIEVDPGYPDTAPFENGEYWADIVVRNNHMVNVGLAGIIFRGCQSCVVEGNEVIWTDDSGPGGQCISWLGNALSANDVGGTAYTIQNNSCYMNSSAAVSTNQVAIKMYAGEGTNHIIANNLVMFGPQSPSNSTCFDQASYVQADFVKWDNNICYRDGSLPTYSSGVSFASRPAWMDPNGLYSNVAITSLLVAAPAVGNGYSTAIPTGSIAKNAGNATYKSLLSYGGYLANGTRDIGAREFGETIIAPSAPPRIGVQ